MASIGGYFNGLLGTDGYGFMSDNQINLEQQKEMSLYNAMLERAQTQYMAQNQMKWQVEGMQNAGLNPVLAATGGLQPTSAGAVQQGKVPTTTENSLTSAARLATIIAGIAMKNPKLISIGIGTPINENKSHTNNTYNNNTFYKK